MIEKNLLTDFMNIRTALLSVWFLIALGSAIYAQPNSARSQKTKVPGFDKLDQAIQKDFGDKFGFSVLVANEEKIRFSKAYGHIDKLKTKPANNGTLFNIASISKSFTTIGVVRLVAQNKLRLTDTISKFINKVPADKGSITIGHLLSHKSGFKTKTLFVMD